MDRLALALAILVAAVAIAAIARRRSGARLARSPDALAGRGHVPSAVDVRQLINHGLSPPEGASAFIVVFTEETCRTCAAALRSANGPSGGGLPVIEIEYSAQRELQESLDIDTVPTTVVVASDGAVLAGWSGKIDEAELGEASQRAAS